MTDTDYKIRDWFARKHGKGWREKYEQWKLEHTSGELPWQKDESAPVDKAASKLKKLREGGVPMTRPKPKEKVDEQV